MFLSRFPHCSSQQLAETQGECEQRCHVETIAGKNLWHQLKCDWVLEGLGIRTAHRTLRNGARLELAIAQYPEGTRRSGREQLFLTDLAK